MFKVQICTGFWVVVAVGCGAPAPAEKDDAHTVAAADDSALPVDDGDGDGDGLDAAAEAALGTDPTNADTDGDGLSDGDEANQGTSPLRVDSDEDGISDADEALEGTDPLVADTDGDGLSDGDELGESDPLLADTDGDGLNDAEEIAANASPNYPDTDSDGYSDYTEVTLGSAPRNRNDVPMGGGPNESAPACQVELITGQHLSPSSYPEGSYDPRVGGPECALRVQVVAPGPVTVTGLSVVSPLSNAFGWSGWVTNSAPVEVALELPAVWGAASRGTLLSPVDTAMGTDRLGDTEAQWMAFTSSTADAAAALGLPSAEPIAVDGIYLLYVSVLNKAGEALTDCEALKTHDAYNGEAVYLRLDAE